MSKKYYTNVFTYGSSVLYRGVENGRRVRNKIQYSPTLFLPTKKNTGWVSLQGDSLEPNKFETIRDAKDFVKKYEGVENFKIFGNTKHEYALIAENHPEEMIDWKIEEICVANLDIEVGSENGFPEPRTASEPITAITIKFSDDKLYYVFGCGDYQKHRDDVEYIKCPDEYHLLKKFLALWQLKYPDVLTGWNVIGFDVPYLMNRIIKIVGEEESKKMSPWNLTFSYEETLYNKTFQTYDLIGISILDYLRLYRKFSPNKSQENYRLDTIAQAEGVGQKITYEEYDGLHDLYKRNYQKFIEYNIRDVELVEKLNASGRLVEMALTIAYDAKVNYNDVFMQVRMWDTICFNHLYNKKIVIPPKVPSKKNAAYEGAYVKEPQTGMFDWVASFDLNSLYPHLMMQYNISPDTIVEPRDYNQTMRKIISDGVSVDKLLKQEINLSGLDGVTLTPNGQFFRTNKQGFLPEILEKMYNDRTKYKKKMLESKQKYENAVTQQEKKEYGDLVSKFNNLQLTKKECLNSAYGALGSEYFRFFDIRQAEGITLAGQLSIRWIENRINHYMNKILKTESKDYVLASDTDSIYLHLGGLIESVFDSTQRTDTTRMVSFMDKVCEEKIQPYIDHSYQDLASYVHAYEQKMKMKREVLADKAIWTAKKRYILNVHNSEGVQYAEPQIKIQGLEAIKSSTPSSCREKIKESLKIILKGSEQELQDYIANFKDEFKQLPIEDISFPRSVNGLDTYSDSKMIWSKGTPMHVRGALVYNHMIDELNLTRTAQKIQEGEKIKFIYLKEPNIFKTDVISFVNRIPKEFNIEQFVDYEMQFEKSFVDPLIIILDKIGWKATKTSSLEDFFG
jgi:DNA polymerase elongation subunit (family B)